MNEFKFDSTILIRLGIRCRRTRKTVRRDEQGSTGRVLQINRTGYQKRQHRRRHSRSARRSEIDEAERQQ